MKKNPEVMTRYRNAQRSRGLTQVRTWVPEEYADWYRLVGQRLREAKQHRLKVEVPPLRATPVLDEG